MPKSIYTKNYKKNLELYWGQFIPNWKIPNGFHVHHIIPKSIGGSHHPRNLIALHPIGGSHHPRNLIALHPDDHISIHKNRGDRVEEKFIVMANNQKGVFKTNEHKEKIRLSNLGKSHNISEDGRNILINRGKKLIGSKNPFYGKKHNEKSLKGLRKLIKCEYCGKESNSGNYAQYHGHNCKNQ